MGLVFDDSIPPNRINTRTNTSHFLNDDEDEEGFVLMDSGVNGEMDRDRYEAEELVRRIFCIFNSVILMF
jgi:hypothetical protein